MTMIVNTTVKPDVLLVRVGGEFSLDEAKRTFLEIISAIEKNNSEKVLFDGREIKGNPTVIDRFYYGEFAAGSVAQLKERTTYDSDPRFAYVLHEPVLDPMRFGEIVAVNRGMRGKAFANIDEAVKWLDLAPGEY
jgi:hypothetical protein